MRVGHFEHLIEVQMAGSLRSALALAGVAPEPLRPMDPDCYLERRLGTTSKG